MTDVDTGQKHNRTALLNDVLATLASSEDSQAALRQLLALSCATLDSAFFLAFEEPRILLVNGTLTDEQLPDAGHLIELAHRLPPGVSSGQAVDAVFAPDLSGTMLLPIRLNGKPSALLGVTGGTDHLHGDHEQTLEVIGQAVAVLLRDIKARAHHARLENNQSEFISIVSHDLRSPLTAMKGFAGMLESGSIGDLNEQQAYFLQKILSGISQLASLVENIQDAGRYDPETGFYKMQRTPCDPTEIVSRIARNHLLPAEKQALSLSVSIADNVPIVNVDAHMLERAIINLVDNAIKYTPNGGEVEVGIRREGDEMLISVRDTGLGISKEHQQNLFERRVRIPREEHKRIKGSGLGLFIVRSVARRHGGEAWIESEIGKGSTFYIGIPLSEENLIVPGEANA